MALIERIEMEMRMGPFSRSDSTSAADQILDFVGRYESFGLDVADYIVQRVNPRSGQVSALLQILTLSGSVWTLTQLPPEESGGSSYWMLTRRDLEAAKQAVTDIRSVSQRAGDFLINAWTAVASRNPDPARGYENAVWAIEAAAQPIVSPANGKATLGTIIRDLEAKPEKWTFALGDLDIVIALARRIWTTQLRHGTQERDPPTEEEADAVVHMAIPLVRYFAGGLIRVVE